MMFRDSMKVRYSCLQYYNAAASQVLEIDFMDRAGNMIQQCPFRMLALQGPRSACRVRLCAKRAWVQTKNQVRNL